MEVKGVLGRPRLPLTRKKIEKFRASIKRRYITRDENKMDIDEVPMDQEAGPSRRKTRLHNASKPY
jgi:hypothetical protein